MNASKRHDLPHVPALAVVATPIGNLGDLAPRAREALERCETLLCEDTRQAARLLAATGIAKSLSRLERLDAHAGEGRIKEIVERMAGGETFALVSDAGTPSISDPGAPLVLRCRELGLEVRPVPGPSAVATLLSVAGFEEACFTFRGFFPRKERERREEIALAAASRAARVSVWFESPGRVVDALGILASAAPTARVVAAKELTKLHEKVFAGTAAEVAGAVGHEVASEGARGEWCFAALFPRSRRGARGAGSEAGADGPGWEAALRCLIECGVSASDAAGRVSQHFGVSRKTVYHAYLKASGKKSFEKS